jgi:flagellar motor switch protein FliG
MSTAAALVDALFTRKPAPGGGKSSDIAVKAPARGNRPLSGSERAAILLLALGEAYGSEVWKLLDDEEIRTLSLTLSALVTIESDAVEQLMIDFVGLMSATGALMGDSAATVRLLQQLLPGERVSVIME